MEDGYEDNSTFYDDSIAFRLPREGVVSVPQKGSYDSEARSDFSLVVAGLETRMRIDTYRRNGFGDRYEDHSEFPLIDDTSCPEH